MKGNLELERISNRFSFQTIHRREEKSIFMSHSDERRFDLLLRYLYEILYDNECLFKLDNLQSTAEVWSAINNCQNSGYAKCGEIFSMIHSQAVEAMRVLRENQKTFRSFVSVLHVIGWNFKKLN